VLSYFQPRHVRQGRAFLKDARKLLAYKSDLVTPETAQEVQREIDALEEAVRGRDRAAIEAQAHKLDQTCSKLTRPVTDAGWRENCEVFLVAIVIALGVRTYFLQPFTIPTGSMQPTLNGIIGHKTAEPPPNHLVRMVQKAVLGRTWIDVVAKSDDVIVDIREIKRLGILSYTELRGERNSYVVNCPRDTLIRYFLPPLRPFKAGEIIARGYHDTGDHVFVDKFSYHFRKPARGDVFVFNTQNISTREMVESRMQGPSQFYIKRLAALPGDTLQIRPPELFVNGERAKGKAFDRVMSARDGYRGYSNESEQEYPNGQVHRFRMKLLGAPEETFAVPPRNYFALGDNSFHSSDSRDWGTVPQQNIMGHGVFVYWPFASHWGFIQ
jgi:signal peptidase I